MQHDRIDEAIEQSFPASDPPEWTGTHAGAPCAGPRGPQTRGREAHDEDLLGMAVAARDRALSPGPLDAKTVAIVAFAVQAARGTDGFAQARAHASAARRQGASTEELRHALLIGAVVGGLGALDEGQRILGDVR